jgi:hypothetical protein
MELHMTKITLPLVLFVATLAYVPSALASNASAGLSNATIDGDSLNGFSFSGQLNLSEQLTLDISTKQWDATPLGMPITLGTNSVGVGYEFPTSDLFSINFGLGRLTTTASATVGQFKTSISRSTTYYKAGVSADISEKTSVSVGLVDATSADYQMDTLFSVSRRMSDDVGLMLSASNSSDTNSYELILTYEF